LFMETSTEGNVALRACDLGTLGQFPVNELLAILPLGPT
jgi:hypothetical protein